MQLKRIAELLEADVLVSVKDLERDITTVHASDLISQVLASCSRGALWITGLLDQQIINTAELFDLSGVVFIGNRRPSADIIDTAVEEQIPVLVTKLSMFEACGLLYAEGLQPALRS